jgi:predicted nucleic acid-binding protein
MSRIRYVVDTSVLARLFQPEVRAAFAPLAAGGMVALCAPVAFELGYSARGPQDHRQLTDRLASFPSIPVAEADHHRALKVQSILAERGAHRAISLVDALVAAIAEVRGLAVLHYDADFELIADVTGQSQAWIVPRGVADGSRHPGG